MFNALDVVHLARAYFYLDNMAVICCKIIKYLVDEVVCLIGTRVRTSLRLSRAMTKSKHICMKITGSYDKLDTDLHEIYTIDGVWNIKICILKKFLQIKFYRSCNEIF